MDEFESCFGSPVKKSSVSSFTFKSDRLHIQQNFNLDRIENLERIGNLCTFSNGEAIKSIIVSEISELKQRNMLLKIANKHGWDTVREYANNPLADDKDDYSKLRSAIACATFAWRYKPYQSSLASSTQVSPGSFQPRLLQF